jgi:LuxR family maltose regulon positive regulatory protein
MSMPLLATKLYVPPPRPEAVVRPRLIARLDAGLRGRLTLVSAPAGFGKTTLVSAWLAGREQPAAWLSLDEGDSDPTRFLRYLVAALQTIAAEIGAGVQAALQSTPPPPPEAILTALLNDIAAIEERFILVLDDYHAVNARPVDEALAFLLDHLPPQMHLVITTREDPQVPLARLRARSQLNELRVADVRFTLDEAAAFLTQAMGLSLAAGDIATLEARTEGWIAGLQLAALSLQGERDPAAFIRSFSGSHHFVLDYLLEEVLHRQPAPIQDFLLRTAILDRLCGPLCDAVLRDPATDGRATLERLEHANLFIVPLDNERRWYRYHHLFAELLRQRAGQEPIDAADLHIRASQWYEDNGLALEAFQHAAAAVDLARAERLIQSRAMPLHDSAVAAAIVGWLGSLPAAALDARPSLWVKYGEILLVTGQTTGVEHKLEAAEAALARQSPDAEPDDATRNLIGHIAAVRATLALTRYQIEALLSQSQRALEYLRPDDLSFRATANWTLGAGYQMLGDRAAAGRAISESIALSRAAGDTFATILATIALGQIQEAENQLHLAAATYRQVLELAGEQPQQIIYEAQLGLAQICYEWNDLAAAEDHGREGLRLARQYESVIDRFIVCEVFLARLKLAQGDLAGAAAILEQAGQSARRQNFAQRLPEVAAAQVLVLLRQGDLAAAARLAQDYDLPISQARVLLAQGDPAAALALLDPLRAQAAAQGWQDEWLRALALQSVAHHLHGASEEALGRLGEALALAEPAGCIRTFIDEGAPMKQLLQAAAARQIAPAYARRLLAAFAPAAAQRSARIDGGETLSERELEVLRHIAEGRTDREIAERLYLSLHTVKVHARNIYGKLGVGKRTQAVARARELGLLPRS